MSPKGSQVYIHNLQLKVGHYPLGRYEHHGGVLNSVTLRLGCLAIEVAIDIYLDVGSSSYHFHISAYGGDHGGCIVHCIRLHQLRPWMGIFLHIPHGNDGVGAKKRKQW